MLKLEQKEMYEFHPFYWLNTPSIDGEEEMKNTTSPTCMIF